MVTLSGADLAIIGVYFAIVVAIGVRTKRRSGDAAEYLLAGRSLTVPLFVMTLVSTWYGGILGVGEFSWRYGISNWFIQGVPYYVFAALFAFFLAPKVRATNLVTIPDKLLQVYGRKTALLGAFLTFLLTTPAPYVLMLAVLLQLVTGWSLVLCLVAGTVVTTGYLVLGGFRADVNTDVVEFILMFAGFGVILPFAGARLGGAEFLSSHLPPLHLTWHGGNSPQFIIVWFFIALWTLVDPSFHQRCYAARSGAVARKGILISILFWFVFDAMTAIAGLYARAALPVLDQPVMAYPLLAEAVLPPFAKGLFYVGMLATIMSTLNTLAFVSATTFGRDVLWRLQGSNDDQTGDRLTRWGLLLTGLLSILLCVTIPSVIRLWYTIGTVVIPGLLVPLVAGYTTRWRVSPAYAFMAMLLGWGTSLLWLGAGWSQSFGSADAYPFGTEPMFPGIFISVVVWGVGLMRRGAPPPADGG